MMTQGRSQPLTALKLSTASLPRVSSSSGASVSLPPTKVGMPARCERTSVARGERDVLRLRTLGART